MAVKIFYKSSVSHDLKNIEPGDKNRILRQVKKTLGLNPKVGEALHGEFQGLFKLRVGDYGVVYTLIDHDVLVLRIRHRAKVYE